MSPRTSRQINYTLCIRRDYRQPMSILGNGLGPIEGTGVHNQHVNHFPKTPNTSKQLDSQVAAQTFTLSIVKPSESYVRFYL